MPANPPAVAGAPPAAAAPAATVANSYTFRKSDLPLLDIESDRGPLFRAWKRRWLDYRLVSGLNNTPLEQQSRVLRQCMSSETLVILENLGVSQDDEATPPDTIISTLTDFADRLVNVNMEWHRLTSRFQHDGEDVNEYVMALRQIAKNCDTCDSNCMDRAVRVQLIRGVKNQDITEALLKVKKITLKEALDTAIALEEAQDGGSKLHQSEALTPTVQRMSTYRMQKRGPPVLQAQQLPRPYIPQRHYYQPRASYSLPQTQRPLANGPRPMITPMTAQMPARQTFYRSPAPQGQQMCPNCGGRPHTRSPCPAQSAICDFCGKRGHFRRVCRAAQMAVVATYDQQGDQQLQCPPSTNMASHDFEDYEREPTEQEALEDMFAQFPPLDMPPDDEIEAAQIQYIASQPSPSTSPKALVNCTVNGLTCHVTALPDSGADISAASFDFLQQFGVRFSDIQSGNRFVRSANGHDMPILGRITVRWTDARGQHPITDQLYIMSGLQCPLLSWRVSQHLQLLHFNFPRVNHIRINPPQLRIRRRHRPTLPQPHGQRERALIQRLQDYFLREFSDVLTNEIKVMKGEMFRIHLTDDAKPSRVSAPRTVPLAYKEKLKQELQNLQSQGIIEPVTHPTEWCSPIVVEPKGDGVRLCVDFTQLNKYVKREFYVSDSPAKQVFDIAQSQARYFTALDATKGYHQCPLEPNDRDYTTFITPFGRFRYLRAPFGISSISEHYNRRMDEALQLRPNNSRRVVDDLALYDALLRAHFHHVHEVLLQCRAQGITLNPKKFKFAEDQIKFAGYMISRHGYMIDPAVHRAIDGFPTPRSITDLRAFFGLVNQLAGMRHDIARHMEPLRPLLSPKNDFLWTSQHDQIFAQVKKCLATSPTLAFFDLSRKTRLLTDASKTGLGFVLQQLDPADATWRVVYAGSRFLNAAEQRYAVIELELLGVCFAFRKCAHMVTALHIDLLTDHKPLVPILNSKRLDEIEKPRLRRMRFSLAQFQFCAHHCSGSSNVAADALSRFPVEPPVVATVEAYMPLSPFQKWIRSHMHDHHTSLLRSAIMDGFPETKSQLPDELKPYWKERDALWISDSLIFKGRSLYIPRSCRSSVLRKLHFAHQGVNRTQALARSFVYWPFLNRDVTNLVKARPLCLRYRDAPPKPPMCQPALPTAPFQDVSLDVFQLRGSYFIAFVDAYSNWLDLAQFKHMPTSMDLVRFLAPIFATFGSPRIIRSDNASIFKSHVFKLLLRDFDVQQHVTSAPYYPQSNGRAENAVKTLKRMVKKVGCDPVHLSQALLLLRNTPNMDGCAPALKVFGRLLPCQLSTPTTSAVTNIEAREAVERAEVERRRQRQRAKVNYDKAARKPKIPPVGSTVAVRSHVTNEFLTKAQVIAVLSPRRLLLRFSDRSLHERDIRQVLPMAPVFPPPLVSSPAAPSPTAPVVYAAPAAPSPGAPVAVAAPVRRSVRSRHPPKRYYDEF